MVSPAADERWYRQSFEILLNKTELTAQMASTLKRERKLTRAMVQLLEDLIAKAHADEGSARSLALLLYSSLMGITHTAAVAQALFAEEQAPFLTRRLLSSMAPGLEMAGGTSGTGRSAE